MKQLAIKSIFKFPPHPTSASALPGESRPSIICVEMNEKTSKNFIYPDLWAPTGSLLQGLIVVQQCFYKTTLRKAWIGLEHNVIETAVNEWRKWLYACVHIIGRHFEQFYCKELKNGQLDRMSIKVSES